MSQDRLKRLIYRSCYTGTKELDLVLGGFARTRLAAPPRPRTFISNRSVARPSVHEAEAKLGARRVERNG